MHAPYQRTLRAHAKVNLMLRVLAREASGFHGVETLLQRIALHDVVHVSLQSTSQTLECDGPAMPPNGLGKTEDNLAYRAACAFQIATDWPNGFHIAIEKHIPVGGGLGGGSADAAAVLRGMNVMCPRPLEPAALLALGAALGADVPFLVADVSLALAWNRGDRMLALPALPPMPLTIVAQRNGVDTGAAYRALDALPPRAGSSDAAFYEAGLFADWANVARLACNDFERVVPALHPGVAEALLAVRGAAETVRARGEPSIGLLSGSGASCFLLAPTSMTPTLPATIGQLIMTSTA